LAGRAIAPAGSTARPIRRTARTADGRRAVMVGSSESD
jgi:hypothetical protein